MAKKILRPALRYAGSKFRHAIWVIPYIPVHKSYCEPFSGGMGLLLRKAPSEIEIVNDLDGDVINFFKQLRDHPQELEELIQTTPYSRQELLDCRNLDREAATPLERARALYVRAWQGFSGPQAQGNPGWRFDKASYPTDNCRRQFYDTHRLKYIAERLKKVEFENNDALVILKNFDHPENFYFQDPPYFQEHLEEGDERYQFIMTPDQHRLLAEINHELDSMVFITGYNSGLYEELYGDWVRLEKKTTTDHNKHVTECLWMNEAAYRNAPKRSLFEHLELPDADVVATLPQDRGRYDDVGENNA